MTYQALYRHNSIFLFMILVSLSIAAPGVLIIDAYRIYTHILYPSLLLGVAILLLIHARSDLINRSSHLLMSYRNASGPYHLSFLLLSCLLWSIFIFLPTWPVGRSSAIQLGYLVLTVSVLLYLYLGGRRIYIRVDRTITSLAIALLIMLSISLVYPVTYEARGKNWDDTLAYLGKSQQELTYLEHFYQLNTDIPGWIAVAASFPHHYYTANARINRPLYPAIISAFCRTIGILKNYPGENNPTCSHNTVFYSGIFVNTVLVLVTLVLWVNLLRKYMQDESIVFLSGLAMVTSAHTLWSLPQPSTNIIGLFIVVFTAWVFEKILRLQHFPFATLLTYSLVYGILMLAKSNYSVLFIFLLIVLRYRRNLVNIVIFMVLHFIPLLFWMAVLDRFGLAYYNHEIATYGQGTWIFEDFIYRDRRQMYHDVVDFLGFFTSRMIFSFGPLALGLLAFSLVKPSIAAGHRWVVMATVVGVATFLFLIRRAPPFLVFDAFFSVLPAVAAGLRELTEWLQQRTAQMLRHETGMIAAVIVVLVNNLIVILASDPQFNLGWP